MERCKHEWEIEGESRDDLGVTGTFEHCVKCGKRLYRGIWPKRTIHPYRVDVDQDGVKALIVESSKK
jgi:hypothetical protein